MLVETEQAQRLGPGEVAVTRGPSAVYLPGWLAAEHQSSLLDVASRGDSGSPTLVLRRRPSDRANLPVTDHWP